MNLGLEMPNGALSTQFLYRVCWVEWQRLRGIWALLLLALLSACQGSGVVDAYHQAQGYDSRVRYIVLHYTGENKADSLAILTQQSVSSHYLITDDEPAHVLQLLDENHRAWHAGASSWYGVKDINTGSIGIEIVNLGSKGSAEALPSRLEEWDSFSPSQMQRLIVLLDDIVQRHNIKPENIVAHSDIAPRRKVDPGPRFSWQTLAQAGLGRWYDRDRVSILQKEYEHNGVPSLIWGQEQLASLGYAIEITGQDDAMSRDVLRAFQMHYRPVRFDGVMDAETAAIIQNLVERQKR